MLHKKEYKADWAKKHRTRLNERSREWHRAHLARSREIKRTWNWTHREQHAAYRYQHERTPEERKRISGRTQAKRVARRLGMAKGCTSPTVDCTGQIQLHHIDRNTANNTPSNLRYLCKYHHMVVHRKPLPRT